MALARATRMQSAPSIAVSPHLVSIAGRVGHVFDPKNMLAGFSCHAQGVVLSGATRDAVHARVKSKRTHDVDLRAANGRLLVHCSCPAESMGLKACKHVWAALLEVDRQGGLEDLRANRGPIPLDVVPASPPKALPSPPPANKKAAAIAKKKAAKR